MVKVGKEITKAYMHVKGDVNKPAESSKLKVEFLGAKDKEIDTSNVETGLFDETRGVETQDTLQIDMQSY